MLDTHYKLSDRYTTVSKDNKYLLINKYHFKNRIGQSIVVEVNVEMLEQIEMYVVFYLRLSRDKDYKNATNSGDATRVLRTVIEAARRTADSIVGGMNFLYVVKIKPSDLKRKSVYQSYLTSRLPQFEVKEKDEWIYLYNKNYSANSHD